jgi:hypothetical protein
MTSAGATWSVGKAVTGRTLATGVPKIKTPVAKSAIYRSVTVARRLPSIRRTTKLPLGLRACTWLIFSVRPLSVPTPTSLPVLRASRRTLRVALPRTGAYRRV